MRTRNFTVTDVEHFAPCFAPLTFNLEATRELHFQAASFYWTDEMPEFVEDNYDASLRHFMIYLLSYRKVLMYRNCIVEFEPLWNRLNVLCPNWPGFRIERMASDLIPELESQVDHELDRFEQAFNDRKQLTDESAVRPGDGEKAT